MSEPIQVEQFGKDHWSTLTYAESRCVDNKGELDFRHMRTNPEKHPGSQGGHWAPGYATRLRDGSVIPGHDDWDCLDDLEKSGMVTVMSMVNGSVRMTDLGFEVVARIRKHLASGGNYAGFIF